MADPQTPEERRAKSIADFNAAATAPPDPARRAASIAGFGGGPGRFDQIDMTRTKDDVLAAGVQQQDLGTDLMRPTTRFNIAAAHTYAEKLAAFKNAYPEGDLVFAPTGTPGGTEGEYLFKKDAASPFARVDATFKEGGAYEPVNDLLEFLAPDIGAIIGETIGATGPGKVAKGVVGAVKAGKNGVRLIKAASRMFMGAFAGEEGQEGAAQVAGFGLEGEGDVAKRAVGQGVSAVAGEAIMAGPVRAVANVARGAGLFNLRAGGAEALRASGRLGLNGLPISVVASWPLIRRLGAQAQSTSSKITDFIDMEQIGLHRIMADWSADLTGKAPDVPFLKSVLDKEKEASLQAMRTYASRGSASLSEAGDALKTGMADYDAKMISLENQAYKLARDAESPEFKMGDVLSAAQIAEVQARAMGDAGKPILDLVRQIRATNARVEGVDMASMRRLLAATDQAKDPELYAEIQKAIAEDAPRLVDQVIQLHDGTTHVTSPTDQLRFLRSQAYDLKTPDPGDRNRQVNRLGAQLFASIDATLKDPTNTSKDFVKKWADANAIAKERFAFRDEALTIEVMQRAEAGDRNSIESLIVDLSNLANPDNGMRWDLMRKVMDTPSIERVRDGVVTELTRDPFAVTRRMNEARPEVLDKVLNKKDQAGIKAYGESMDLLKRTGFEQVVTRQAQLGVAVTSMVKENNTAEIARLLDVVKRNGGIDGQLGTFFKAGILDDIVASATVYKGDGKRLDVGKLNAKVMEYERAGALKFFTAEERRKIFDARILQEALTVKADVGASMHGASAAREFFHGAINTMVENAGIGGVLINPTIRKLFIGSGAPKNDMAVFSAIAGAVGLLATDGRQMYDWAGDILATIPVPDLIKNAGATPSPSVSKTVK